ncbi:MAG: rhodanese-like domain-containing protein [Candidatus Kapabacteria bacterium]|nr:rhodanese-like domain-containing protein [Candidatus Kapabacteria bacterium]
MKYILSFFAAIFTYFNAGAMTNLSQHEQFKKSEILIIDVRTLDEFKSGNIKGSILIPYNEIHQHISTITKSKDAPIAVYCRSGSRSGIALRILQSMGYTNVINYGSFSSAKKILDNKV